MRDQSELRMSRTSGKFKIHSLLTCHCCNTAKVHTKLSEREYLYRSTIRGNYKPYESRTYSLLILKNKKKKFDKSKKIHYHYSDYVEYPELF